MDVLEAAAAAGLEKSYRTIVGSYVGMVTGLLLCRSCRTESEPFSHERWSIPPTIVKLPRAHSVSLILHIVRMKAFSSGIDHTFDDTMTRSKHYYSFGSIEFFQGVCSFFNY